MEHKIYLPDVVGKGYGTYWNFKGRYRVCKGSRASKKSKTTALNFIVRMMQYPQANLLVVRQTAKSIADSCYTELEWAIHRLGVEKYWACKTSPQEMIYKPTGQKIYFRGLDDPYKITSITVSTGVLCWLWIEEAYEIMEEASFDTLDECIRGQVPDGLFKQTTLTFNPWNATHWLKERFFDVVDDNILAMTTNYLCNEWLDQADSLMFADMKVRRPRRYEVAGLGNWGVTEGVIFDNWTVEDFNTKGFDNFYNGQDFGYAADPNAYIRVHVDMGRKRIYVLDEIYKAGMQDEELAEELRKRMPQDEYVTCDIDNKSIDYLRRRGIRAVPAFKGPNSINYGIKFLQGYEIIIHPNCVHFHHEISNYQWQKDKYGNWLEKPVDKDNHLMDALRYAVEPLHKGTINKLRRL